MHHVFYILDAPVYGFKSPDEFSTAKKPKLQQNRTKFNVNPQNPTPQFLSEYMLLVAFFILVFRPTIMHKISPLE